MIGKILADLWGWTKALGGTENAVGNITTKELRQLKQGIKSCNTTAEVDVVINERGLSNVKGLPTHIKELYEKGKIKKLTSGDVNKFIIAQNNQNIANQAHGILGIRNAINAYNESLTKNEDGTRMASEGTNKLNSAISQSNSSLGNYLTRLDGAEARLRGYVGSLATATLKQINCSYRR